MKCPECKQKPTTDFDAIWECIYCGDRICNIGNSKCYVEHTAKHGVYDLPSVSLDRLHAVQS